MVKIKVTRENKAAVYRSVVLIDDRALPFVNGDEIAIYVPTNAEMELTVYCQGPRGANTTVKVERASGTVIDPLTALVDNDYGVSHASDVFKVLP